MTLPSTGTEVSLVRIGLILSGRLETTWLDAVVRLLSELFVKPAYPGTRHRGDVNVFKTLCIFRGSGVKGP